MSDDLKADLTEIQGVGESTANKVIDILHKHGALDDPPYVAKAKAAADAGNYREAAVYLQRVD